MQNYRINFYRSTPQNVELSHVTVRRKKYIDADTPQNTREMSNSKSNSIDSNK